MDKISFFLKSLKPLQYHWIYYFYAWQKDSDRKFNNFNFNFKVRSYNSETNFLIFFYKLNN